MIRTTMLDIRLECILKEIKTTGSISSTVLQKLLQNQGISISKITLLRDIQLLLGKNLIVSSGNGKKKVYMVHPGLRILEPVNTSLYFENEQTERNAFRQFQFDIFDTLGNIAIFTTKECEYLEALTQTYRNNLIAYQNTGSEKKEFERILIEFAWKSSQIEGNTYTLLDTESLIKYHEKAHGKTEYEAQMILNHKYAFDVVFKEKEHFLTLKKDIIENIHALLIQNLGIQKNIRTKPVGITGTDYRPLDNVYQIQEALDALMVLVNNRKNFFEKSLLILTMLSYIQAFEDGNKRTARMMANAILLAYDAVPISYRAVSETEYKKASIVFYEQNNISSLKEIFIEQYAFAVHNYFFI